MVNIKDVKGMGPRVRFNLLSQDQLQLNKPTLTARFKDFTAKYGDRIERGAMFVLAAAFGMPIAAVIDGGNGGKKGGNGKDGTTPPDDKVESPEEFEKSFGLDGPVAPHRKITASEMVPKLNLTEGLPFSILTGTAEFINSGAISEEQKDAFNVKVRGEKLPQIRQWLKNVFKKDVFLPDFLLAYMFEEQKFGKPLSKEAMERLVKGLNENEQTEIFRKFSLINLLNSDLREVAKKVTPYFYAEEEDIRQLVEYTKGLTDIKEREEIEEYLKNYAPEHYGSYMFYAKPPVTREEIIPLPPLQMPAASLIESVEPQTVLPPPLVALKPAAPVPAVIPPAAPVPQAVVPAAPAPVLPPSMQMPSIPETQQAKIAAPPPAPSMMVRPQYVPSPVPVKLPKLDLQKATDSIISFAGLSLKDKFVTDGLLRAAKADEFKLSALRAEAIHLLNIITFNLSVYKKELNSLRALFSSMAAKLYESVTPEAKKIQDDLISLETTINQTRQTMQQALDELSSKKQSPAIEELKRKMIEVLSGEIRDAEEEKRGREEALKGQVAEKIEFLTARRDSEDTAGRIERQIRIFEEDIVYFEGMISRLAALGAQKLDVAIPAYRTLEQIESNENALRAERDQLVIDRQTAVDSAIAWKERAEALEAQLKQTNAQGQGLQQELDAARVSTGGEAAQLGRQLKNVMSEGDRLRARVASLEGQLSEAKNRPNTEVKPADSRPIEPAKPEPVGLRDQNAIAQLGIQPREAAPIRSVDWIPRNPHEKLADYYKRMGIIYDRFENPVDNYVSIWVSEDQVIQAVKVLKGTKVTFDEQGKIESIILLDDLELKGVKFKKEQYVNFYENGNLRNGTLEGDQIIQGINVSGGTIIELHPNGKVQSAMLKGNHTVDDITYAAGSKLELDELGRVVKGVLAFKVRQGTTIFPAGATIRREYKPEVPLVLKGENEPMKDYLERIGIKFEALTELKTDQWRAWSAEDQEIQGRKIEKNSFIWFKPNGQIESVLPMNNVASRPTILPVQTQAVPSPAKPVNTVNMETVHMPGFLSKIAAKKYDKAHYEPIDSYLSKDPCGTFQMKDKDASTVEIAGMTFPANTTIWFYLTYGYILTLGQPYKINGIEYAKGTKIAISGGEVRQIKTAEDMVISGNKFAAGSTLYFDDQGRLILDPSNKSSLFIQTTRDPKLYESIYQKKYAHKYDEPINEFESKSLCCVTTNANKPTNLAGIIFPKGTLIEHHLTYGELVHLMEPLEIMGIRFATGTTILFAGEKELKIRQIQLAENMMIAGDYYSKYSILYFDETGQLILNQYDESKGQVRTVSDPEFHEKIKKEQYPEKYYKPIKKLYDETRVFNFNKIEKEIVLSGMKIPEGSATLEFILDDSLVVNVGPKGTQVKGLMLKQGTSLLFGKDKLRQIGLAEDKYIAGRIFSSGSILYFDDQGKLILDKEGVGPGIVKKYKGESVQVGQEINPDLLERIRNKQYDKPYYEPLDVHFKKQHVAKTTRLREPRNIAGINFPAGTNIDQYDNYGLVVVVFEPVNILGDEYGAGTTILINDGKVRQIKLAEDKDFMSSDIYASDGKRILEGRVGMLHVEKGKTIFFSDAGRLITDID